MRVLSKIKRLFKKPINHVDVEDEIEEYMDECDIEYDIDGKPILVDKDGYPICPCCGEKMVLNEIGVPTAEGIKVINIHENKVRRNEPCPCGSGKKYKKCCGNVVGL